MHTGMPRQLADAISLPFRTSVLPYSIHNDPSMLQLNGQCRMASVCIMKPALLYSLVFMLTQTLPSSANEGRGNAGSRQKVSQLGGAAETQNVTRIESRRGKRHRSDSVSRPRVRDGGQIEQELAKKRPRKGKRHHRVKRDQRNRFHFSGSFELVLGEQVKLRGSGAVTLDLDQQTARELLDTVNKQLDQVIPLIGKTLDLLSGLPKSMESASKILNFLSAP